MLSYDLRKTPYTCFDKRNVTTNFVIQKPIPKNGKERIICKNVFSFWQEPKLMKSMIDILVNWVTINGTQF